MHTLYHGNCLDILPKLWQRIDAIVSDPPYGMGLDTDYTRFSGSLHSNGEWALGVPNDDKPFDPAHLLNYPQVVLFGMNHYPDKLPAGGAFVWLKKRDSQMGQFLSDAEIAWVKGIQGVYVFTHIWHGFDRESERGEKVLHPTQKPVAVMQWIIERVTNPGDTVCDPYMGSGSTGVAAILSGRNFVGIEMQKEYFDTAQERIENAARQMRGEFRRLADVRRYNDLPLLAEAAS